MIINLDDNETNSDWIKTRVWDLPYRDLSGYFDFEGLSFASAREQVDSIMHFITLPAFTPAPDSLKAQIADFLDANSAISGVQKYAAGQPHDRMGRFASTHGVPQTIIPQDAPQERPYELTPSAIEGDKRGWMGDAYTENPAMCQGEQQSLLLDNEGVRGLPQVNFEGQLVSAALGARRGDLKPGEEPNKDFYQSIIEDPNYPVIPAKYTNDFLARAAWAQNVGWKTIGDADPANHAEIKGRAFKDWYAENPAEASAYLKKENDFVRAKMRAVKLEDGKTVGEVSDAFAGSVMEQMGAVAQTGSVSLTMPASKLRAFVAGGEYKTVYVTTRTNKGGSREEYLDARMSFETAVGVPMRTEGADRPVYGVIGRGKNEVTYGDAQVIFKDGIKNRTTMTLGDSLDGHAKGAQWVSSWSNGEVSSAQFWNENHYTIANIMGNNFRSGTTFTWGYKNAEDKQNNYATWGDIRGYSGKADTRSIATYGYFEAQIHGGVKISDIARIVIPTASALPKGVQASLATQGIEIVVGDHIEKRKVSE